MRTAASGSPWGGLKRGKRNLFTRVSGVRCVNAVWSLNLKALEWNVFRHANGRQIPGMTEAVGPDGLYIR